MDLSSCTDIREIDIRGTTLNITLPQNPKLTTYKLGTPNIVTLINPTVLQPSGVTIDSSLSI
jgi:hypothetical protein